MVLRWRTRKAKQSKAVGCCHCLAWLGSWLCRNTRNECCAFVHFAGFFVFCFLFLFCFFVSYRWYTYLANQLLGRVRETAVPHRHVARRQLEHLTAFANAPPVPHQSRHDQHRNLEDDGDEKELRQKALGLDGQCLGVWIV